jgi:uroporphyrinogen decarboxylase
MTSRQRVLAALNHREPDRVPLDIGGSLATGINVGAYRALKEFLGLDTPTVLMSRRSQTAVVEDTVRERMGIDTSGILARGPSSAESLLPDGGYCDEWGVVRHKPESGHYYVTQPPFAGHPTLSDLAAFPWPEPDDPGYVQGLREEHQALLDTDYAIMLSLPVGFVHQAQFMRGYAEYLLDLLVAPRFAEELMDRILEIHLAVTGRMLETVGGDVDVVLYADDLGCQDQPMLSPDLYRRFIKPRQRRLVDFVKARTAGRMMYHTCGAIYPLIGDFVDIGIDVLNPVQTTAAGMEPARLKAEFGRDLVFWGGVDLQRLLPCGTPAEVIAAVDELVACLGRDGGFVVSAANIIQPDVPPQNLWAMARAVVAGHDNDREND